MNSPSARLSSDSPSSASAPRRRLSRLNRDNNNRDAMVDASPQPGRPQPHNRTSFLSNMHFSFTKNRSNSATGNSLLSTVREVSGSGGNNTDEFGQQPRPQLSTPSTSTITSNTAQNTSSTMTSNANASPAGRPGSSGGAGAGAGPASAPAPARVDTLSQQPPQLHPEIRSIVQLSQAHSHKVYFSGPLVKHVERHTDGKIVGKEEPWREVWAQLGGTTLSVWDMKEIEEASKRGAEVPPTYLNITDASIHVLGAVTMPGADGNPVKYMNVVTLTTAGLNLLLFSCPNPQSLVSWTAALRLAAYEKSRLEELYTAHLLRMSLSEQGVWKDPRSPLVNDRLEGWVKIRINGQTDWKRLWMCVQAGHKAELHPPDGSVMRKNRMSSLFGRNAHEHSSSITSIPEQPGGIDPRMPHISLYTSAKPRDRKKAVLTLVNVTQVFAVYPERPELISRSTLIKMEGFIGDEELAGEWRSRDGWLLLMPEAEAGKLGSLEMLKWLVGLHDALNLYGRPAGYTWNPRDPNSLMFAYPVGPHRDNLFLDRELAESVDPREDRGSVVRQRFKQILLERMYGQGIPPPSGNGSTPPSLPPIQSVAERQSEESQESQGAPQLGSAGFQLPPLSFDNSSASVSNAPPVRETSSLSPITERTDSHSQSRGSTRDNVHSPPSASMSQRTAPTQATIEEEEGVLGDRRAGSPASGAVAYSDISNEQRQRRAGTTSPQARSTELQHQQRAGTTSPQARPQVGPRFSQESGAPSGSGSGVGSPVNPMLGAVRSPPLSPESSISRYSQPEDSTLSTQHTNGSPPENMQSLVFERETTLSPLMASSMSSVPPRMMQQQQQQQQQEQTPLSPGSTQSHTTFMSSPFSIHEVASRNKEYPPVPPSKGPEGQQGRSWEPQYKHKARESEYVFDEPGALYYMQQQRQAEEGTHARTPAAGRHGEDDDDDESEEEEEEEEERSAASEHSVLTNPMSIQSMASPSRLQKQNQQQPQETRGAAVPVSATGRRQSAAGFEVVSGAVGTAALASVSRGGPDSVRSGRSDMDSVYSGGAGPAGISLAPESPATSPGPRGLGRRPSGARAPPRVAGGKRFVLTDSPSSRPREVDEQSPASSPQPPQHTQQDTRQMSAHDDETVDALAALSFLEQEDASSSEPAQTTARQQQKSPSAGSSVPPPPTILEPEDRAPSPQEPSSNKQQYRSSFAPSRQAAERKARSQAQQAAHDEAKHKPGRPNGKQRTKQREGGWESSEDEEEEEEDEDEEDDDAGTDDEPRAASRPGSGAGGPSIAAPVGRNPMLQQQMRGLSPSNSGMDDYRDQQGQQRAVRTLPQIPQRGRSPGGSDRRYDQYEGPRDSSMGRPQYPQQQQQFQQQYQQQYPQQFQQPGAARQNIWSSVLDAKGDSGMPPPNNSNNRDTFVQIETPAETMTKAFTPQGLLSAGMQDKQDRSAKRQEELARESGASLINVPNKPPPPQVGLLGAITAHEREKKREGGIGATLTEREREKRLAEDRQRRLDEFQRQQLEQQQQYAAQFGSMGMYGGGLTPQMTGMNPMMGGGFGGYPQMMGPQSMYFNPMFNPMVGNPQHLFAAQQAAQAYQQAMIAMSTAGSQVGGDGGNVNNGGRVSPGMGPMGGASSPAPMMGGGMGYDPRMSMMGFGGMMPMMGAMPGMASPMGMQMTGGSNMGGQGGMDPRFSLGPGAFEGTGGLSANHTPGGSGQQSQRVSSYNGSPAASPAPGPSNRRGSADERTER